MKKLGLLAALLMLCACNVMTGTHDTANQRFMREQNRTKAENETAQVLYAPGQPGKITVKGTIVSKDGDGAELDQRISVTQRLGKSERLQAKIAAVTNDDSALSRVYMRSVPTVMNAKLSGSKNYAALGCSPRDLSDFTSMDRTEVSLQGDSLHLAVNTVIICGKYNLPFSQVSIAAEKLILRNAHLSLAGSGSLLVSTNSIFLFGKNKIETLGADAEQSVQQAASLELDVLQAIDGEGSLKLHSQGGNCKKP